MYLTISSVVTTCLLVSCLALIFVVLFKSNWLLESIGPGCMIAVFVVIIVRMFVPFEFWYTHSIRVEDVLPTIRRMLVATISIGPYEIHVWRILCVIWALGIIASFGHKVVSFRQVARCVSRFPQVQWSEIGEKYGLKLEAYGDLSKTRLVISETVNSPCVIGLLKPCLLVPRLSFEKDHLRYIIMHELMHVKNKDILWKILVDLLCTMFWWNPIFGYLKKELFRLIEMRNDMVIISRLSGEEQVRYMECLKEVALNLPKKEVSFGVAFSISDYYELKRRMQLIAGTNRFSRCKQVVVIVMMCIGLFASSAIIFEPHTLLSEEEAGGIPVTAENTYLIINQDSYDVYIEGEYFFSTDDLSPFPGVKIYKSLEEVSQND